MALQPGRLAEAVPEEPGAQPEEEARPLQAEVRLVPVVLPDQALPRHTAGRLPRLEEHPGRRRRMEQLQARGWAVLPHRLPDRVAVQLLPVQRVHLDPTRLEQVQVAFTIPILRLRVLPALTDQIRRVQVRLAQ